MGGSHRHLVVNDDEDEEEEDDVYMYPTNMNPNERADYRAACRASKGNEWNRHDNKKKSL